VHEGRRADTYHQHHIQVMTDGGSLDRSVDTIDRELELLTAMCKSIRRLGGTTSTALVDELLDERRVWTSNYPRRRQDESQNDG